MFFNSIEFALFLPIVFILYWVVAPKYNRLRIAIILVSSYFFYGWWDPRFLLLIALSSLVDYLVGYQLGKTTRLTSRKLLLGISIGVNLGLLLFFKYYNFFADNFAQAFTLMGKSIPVRTLNIILPVGISFYTFQTMSYTIDVYRQKMNPTRDMLSFFAYVSFFPQLVAGPIERATNLLPQFKQVKKFHTDDFTVGIKYIVWGLFKKMVIADNCAVYVNDAFANYQSLNASTLFIAVVLFAFQIYGDFSGYSDIAIGTARLFGYRLLQNFALPYFATDISDFWRRWHISLTTWVNEYVYNPMVFKFRYWNTWGVISAVLITFLLLGFWHGANWNFIVFGLLQGIAITAEMLTRKIRKKLRKKVPKWISTVIGMGLTFAFFSFSLIFFRASSIREALAFINRLFSSSILSDYRSVQVVPFLILFLLALEWLTRNHENVLLATHIKIPFWLRYAYYSLILSLIGVFGYLGNIPFVYFQF